MIKKRYFFRIKNAGLTEIEQAKVVSMARKGYYVSYISKNLLVFKRDDEPRQIKARLIYYDVAEPGYNRFVDSYKKLGWQFEGNDGLSVTLFTTEDLDAQQPEAGDKQERVIKRHYYTQLALVFIGIAAFAFVFPQNIKTGLILSRKFMYGAWVALVLQWIYAAICERQNLSIVRGEAPPRNSALAYRIHIALICLAIALLLCTMVLFTFGK